VLTAEELHRRGREASNAGRHAKARGLLTRALERCDDDGLRARILASLAHVESELGDRSSGLELCDQALAIPGLSSSVRGLLHSQRGLLLMRAGLGDEAMEAFAEALSLLGEDPETRFRVHLNRGNVYLQRADPRPAIADFVLAVSYAREAGLPIQQAKAEYNVGFAQLLAGDLVSALKMMDRAKPTLSSLSLVFEAVCEQDRAEALAASGMVSEAERALRAASSAFGARRLRQQQAEAELTLARLLQLDEPAEAAKVARRARRRFEQRGSLGWSMRADAVATAAAIQAGSTAPELIDRADHLVKELRDHGLASEAESLQLHAAWASLRRGDLANARAEIRGAGVRVSSPLTTRLLDREVRAALSRTSHRPFDAMRHVRRGLADLHDWQSSFGSLDLQSSLVGHGRGLALEGLSLAVEDGRPEVVFEWAERARALATRVSPVRPPTDDETASDLAELRQLQGEIASAESSGTVPKQLILHANRLRERIRQRAWYGEGSGQVTEPAGLDEAVAALDGTPAAILSYLVIDDQLLCLVVTAGHPELVAL
jgi:tetratricopeptide (TPR) repeat protein